MPGNLHIQQKKKSDFTKQDSVNSKFNLSDYRTSSLIQQKQIKQLQNKNLIQKKSNNTGLPDNLKSGIENLSGIRIGNVKLHYNSSQPAQFKTNNEVIQRLVSAGGFNERIRHSGANPDNLFIAAIRSALGKYHTQKKPLLWGKQEYADEVMKSLDKMEHAAYSYLVVNRARPDREKQVVQNLLNEIQEAHTEAVEYIHTNNLKLYTPDHAAMTPTQSNALDQDWNQLRNDTGTVKIDPVARSYGQGTEDVNLPEFAKHNRAMFARILSRPAGRNLMHQLLDNSDGQNLPIVIRPYHPDIVEMGQTGAEANSYNNNAIARTKGAAKRFKRRRRGAGSLIGLESGLQDNAQTNQDAAGHHIPTPAFIVVAHELIHTLHNKKGDNQRNVKSQNYQLGSVFHGWTNKEEHRTIETGSDVTENMIRREHGLGRRQGH